MSGINNEARGEGLPEVERLRLENSKLREEWLEVTDEPLSYTGLPGHLHRIDVKIKQLNRQRRQPHQPRLTPLPAGLGLLRARSRQKRDRSFPALTAL